MQQTLQHGSFSSVSQPLIVWSVICPLNIFSVQADDDGSGGGIALWVAVGVIAMGGSWNSRVISSSMDGRSVARRPVCWGEGADVNYWPTLILICCSHSLLTTLHLHTAHQLSVWRIACTGSGTKNVPRPDRTDIVRAKTVPETVPVLSLVSSIICDCWW